MAEFAGLFIATPMAIWLVRLGGIRLPVIPILWCAAALCMGVLWRDGAFDRRQLMRWPRHNWPWRRILLRFAAAASVLVLAISLWCPDRLFDLVVRRPALWAIIMLLYPVLSVYPQHLVFRVFLFHRYAPLVPGPRAMVMLSACAFSLSHIVFANVVAVGLTLAGGLMFARTYEHTGSSMAAWLEHALYGMAVFTVGLGTYFYHGTMALVR